MKLKFLFIFFFLTILLSSGRIVLAASPVPNMDIGFLSLSYDASGGDIAGYIQNFYNFALGISGALAMAMIVYGGIRYATSAGRPDAQTDAKDAIYSALFGVVLLFGAVLLLKTVNPQIITLSTSGVEASGTTCPPGQVYCKGTPPSTSKCMKPCLPDVTHGKQIFTSDCQASGSGPVTTPVCKPAVINCPRTVMATSTCPGAVMLSNDLTHNPGRAIVGRRVSDGTLINVSGDLVLAGVTDNDPDYAKFYDEDEITIPKFSVIWTYPYYERSNEDKSDAKCIIYAWKTKKTANLFSWLSTNCNDTTLRCQEYEPIEKTDLDSNIKPC